MKITKYGHCCLLVEIDGKYILTDPGGWTELPDDMPRIDIVLITHEHSDHLDLDNLKKVLESSPDAAIITNATTAAKFASAGDWKYEAVERGISEMSDTVKIEMWQSEHAPITEQITPVDNTSFLIDETLYLPGDAFFIPDHTVELLALPVCGPWMHINEALEFAKVIEPKMAFPIHDGMLAEMGPFHSIPGMILPEFDIEFKPLLAGESFTYTDKGTH